jgi:hypothetical protein
MDGRVLGARRIVNDLQQPKARPTINCFLLGAPSPAILVSALDATEDLNTVSQREGGPFGDGT